eukprot:14891345-Alexandrium_andersonii.AAC.1
MTKCLRYIADCLRVHSYPSSAQWPESVRGAWHALVRADTTSQLHMLRDAVENGVRGNVLFLKFRNEANSWARRAQSEASAAIRARRARFRGALRQGSK